MEEKQYTKQEIKNMSYWELWGLRRKANLWYFMTLIGIYSFLIYAFIKCMYILLKGDSLTFNVDLWAIPLFVIAGPIYYYGHELYYKNVFLKKNNR